MNEALSIALPLPEDEEKPSRQYRTSPYTAREYAALPWAQRVAVDAICSAAACLIYSFHQHSSGQPYRLGRRPAHVAKNQNLGLAA